MAQLDHEQLAVTHTETLDTSRRSYGLGAKILFCLLEAVYGKPRTFSKFKVIELVARVPYQAWEQVACIAIAHTPSHPDLARRVFDRVAESRRQEDNEQWHLLILEELIAKEGGHEGWVKFTLIAQALAFVYYQLSWLLYVIRRAWNYRLSADFEDRAEHEYAHLVDEHPEWGNQPFESAFAPNTAIPGRNGHHRRRP